MVYQHAPGKSVIHEAVRLHPAPVQQMHQNQSFLQLYLLPRCLLRISRQLSAMGSDPGISGSVQSYRR